MSTTASADRVITTYEIWNVTGWNLQPWTEVLDVVDQPTTWGVPITDGHYQAWVYPSEHKTDVVFYGANQDDGMMIDFAESLSMSLEGYSRHD